MPTCAVFVSYFYNVITTPAFTIYYLSVVYATDGKKELLKHSQKLYRPVMLFKIIRHYVKYVIIVSTVWDYERRDGRATDFQARVWQRHLMELLTVDR